MKHADSRTLAHLAPLLAQVRQRMPPLKEKGAGKFYLKSAAFLHFHDDPTGLFADLKVQGDWQRYPVNHAADYATLLQALDRQLPPFFAHDAKHGPTLS
ncbi:hypothetical protein [Nodosilinea nodulosa]|uniref:hypothetical protein n=1 Tax=Nodosilinea nodulosa TaxID=416001 RepID=UPI000306C536|nr:hypothetical protein [Nodosilinea nodulosa]